MRAANNSVRNVGSVIERGNTNALHLELLQIERHFRVRLKAVPDDPRIEAEYTMWTYDEWAATSYEALRSHGEMDSSLNAEGLPAAYFPGSRKVSSVQLPEWLALKRPKLAAVERKKVDPAGTWAWIERAGTNDQKYTIRLSSSGGKLTGTRTVHWPSGRSKEDEIHNGKVVGCIIFFETEVEAKPASPGRPQGAQSGTRAKLYSGILGEHSIFGSIEGRAPSGQIEPVRKWEAEREGEQK